MNCTDVQNKSLDYLEENLPANEMAAVQAHLEQCASCRQYMQFVKKAYSTIDREKELQVNPFLATRVIQQSRTGKAPVRKPALIWLQHALAVIILAAGIFLGVNTGMRMHAETSQQEQITYSTSYYIDDLKQENVEILISEQP